jgi:hypothetical protein
LHAHDVSTPSRGVTWTSSMMVIAAAAVALLLLLLQAPTQKTAVQVRESALG